MTTALQLSSAVSRLKARRAEIAQRLEEIPSLRAALDQLDSIILAHRQAIVSEEDRTGPKLRAIAAKVRAYLDALEDLGRKASETDQALGRVTTTAAIYRSRGGMGQFLEWGIFLAVIGGLIGVNVSLSSLERAQADKEKARVELAQTITDLKRQGVSQDVINSLTGVYDGLGGTAQQTGQTVIRLAVVGAVGFVGWKLFDHFWLKRHR